MAKEVIKKENSEEGEKVVSFSDKVTIIGTEKADHLITGQEYEVHPVQAEKLVKNGCAELKK